MLNFRGASPTRDSVLAVLDNLHVENGKIVAVSKHFINAYIDTYDMADTPYNLSKTFRRQVKTGCRSEYHVPHQQQNGVWKKQYCAKCEKLEYNWERASWPRVHLLTRHLSSALAQLILLHLTDTLYDRLITTLLNSTKVVPCDQLVLRFAKTSIKPRQLISVLGIDEAKDLEELKRLQTFPAFQQRITSLLSTGYATRGTCKFRKGRIAGRYFHVFGPFIITDVYKRIIEIALREPFVLKLAAPFKTSDSAEHLTHYQILQKLINRVPIHGSLELCKKGISTNLDVRGSVFIDLIHCASHNPEGVLAPLDALHFSPDPSYQKKLEEERRAPWAAIPEPQPALILLLEAAGKKPRQEKPQSCTGYG